MSAIPSFFDISIIKGKQIIWTIDLSKKENGHLHSPQISETISNNLYQLVQNNINDIISTLDASIPPETTIDTDNNIRKIAKKILKSKRIRLSELASQLQLKKGNLRTWLKKGINPEGDMTDYAEVMKNWFENSKGFLSQDEMYDVINSFNKSLRKNLIKAYPENSAIASSQLIEAVVLDNRFPMKKIKTDQGEKLTTGALNNIQIDVSQNDIQISESLLWDEEDNSPERLEKFAYSLIKDILDDQKVNISNAQFLSLMNEVISQIKQQVEVTSNIKKQIDPLIGFNANSLTYKQKEQIIKVTLDIKEDGFRVQDSFDWEIDPVLNQPEAFAERYAKENHLTANFVSIIASQIRQQIDEHLQKRMKSFVQLFEPKILEPENANSEKKTNNKIKENILYSLSEGLETFPVVPPFKEELFLKNQELFVLLNKNSDLLSPIHKKIFLRQLSCTDSSLIRPSGGYGPLGSSMPNLQSKTSQSSANTKKSQFPRHLQSTQKASKPPKTATTPTSLGANGMSLGGLKPFPATPNLLPPPNMVGMPAGSMPNQDGNTQFPGYIPFRQPTTMGTVQQGFPSPGGRMHESLGSTPVYNMDGSGFLKG